MSELYLIAHKVRGEPAFDVAERMGCPECDGIGRIRDKRENPCSECDGTGYWWIIPTSGHRAYVWRWWRLFDLHCEGPDEIDPQYEIQNGIPDEVPDHYTTHAAPSRPSLKDLLPPQPVYRRF